jgi:hypothetical protein
MRLSYSFQQLELLPECGSIRFAVLCYITRLSNRDIKTTYGRQY